MVCAERSAGKDGDKKRPAAASSSSSGQEEGGEAKRAKDT